VASGPASGRGRRPAGRHRCRRRDGPLRALRIVRRMS
jgi:hypothetical protein